MTGSLAGHFFVLYEGILWAAVWFVVLLRGFIGLMRGFIGLMKRFWWGVFRHFFFNTKRRHTSPPPQAPLEHIKRATRTETLPMARLTPARSTSGAH